MDSHGPPMIRDRAIVDVWLASLDDDVHEMEHCLAPDELMRARSFVDIGAARRYVAGRVNLRRILATYLDCGAAEVQFQYGQFASTKWKPRTEIVLQCLPRGRTCGVCDLCVWRCGYRHRARRRSHRSARAGADDLLCGRAATVSELSAGRAA